MTVGEATAPPAPLCVVVVGVWLAARGLDSEESSAEDVVFAVAAILAGRESSETDGRSGKQGQRMASGDAKW